MTRSTTLGVLFSTVVRAAVVAKLVISGILPLISFILALTEVLIAKLVTSSILSSIFLILALYTSFLTESFFTTSLGLLLNQQKQVLIYQHLIYLLYFPNSLNQLVHFLIYVYLIYLH